MNTVSNINIAVDIFSTIIVSAIVNGEEVTRRYGGHRMTRAKAKAEFKKEFLQDTKPS